MNSEYKKLMEPYQFKCGAVIPNRLAMAPMTTKGSSYDGTVGKDDIAFYSTRSKTAGLLITGATSVSKFGEAFSYQFSIAEDRYINGLREISKNMKKNGSKAIVQIYHGGNKSAVSFERFGKAYTPSEIDAPYLPYKPQELNNDEILSIINDFGLAVIRAIEAGFDGVEIHGANHHLIQQFFSTNTNLRNDHWGGSVSKRMNFALEIICKVKEVAAKYAPKNFIIGYRITQTEIHGNDVGYGIDESLRLIDKVANFDLDYIHVSRSEYGEQVKNVINGRTAFIYIANKCMPNDVLAALNFGDIIAIGRAALMEPLYAEKIKDGNENAIFTQIESIEMANSLAFPKKLCEWMLDPNENIPRLPGLNYIESLIKS